MRPRGRWQLPEDTPPAAIPRPTRVELAENKVAGRTQREESDYLSDVDRVSREIEEVIGLDCSGAILCSGKQGLGIEDILEAVVERIPPPKDTEDEKLRALIFDSYYDPYR